MKWLFVTVDFPWPLVKGYCVRIYNLSRALIARGDRVSLLCYPGNRVQNEAYSKLGVEIISGLKGRSRQKGKSRSFLAPFVYHDSLAKLLSECGCEFDIIVLVNSETLQYSPEACSCGAFVLANVADDPVLEIYRRMKRLKNPIMFGRYAKFIVGHLLYERSFVRYVDLLTFVSSTDAESFSRRHREANVRFVPNGVDVEYYRRRQSVVPSFLEKFRRDSVIVFPGNMSHPPNVDAAEFIVNEIAPLVWSRSSDVCFVLAGCNPSERVKRLGGERVIVTGFVEDLRPILWNCCGVIIPMRIGTGIKNKLLEAWASESAVIATSRACQGIPARSGENLLIGDSADELAEQIEKLIADDVLRKRIARGGRETVEREMTWMNTISQLYEYIPVVSDGESAGKSEELSSVSFCCAEDCI